MTRTQTILVALLGLILTAVAYAATETRERFFDGGAIRVVTGTTDVDASAADYTSFQTLLTISPSENHAMHDVKVWLDLDKTTTGWDTVQAATTGQIVVARKVDGTNWRNEIATVTTLTHGGNVDDASRFFDLGTVCPDQDVRLEILVSAEGGDIEIPYFLTYRSGAAATVTEVAN